MKITYKLLILFLININVSYAEIADFSEANMLYRQAMMLYSDGDYKEASDKMADIQKKAPDYPHIKKVFMNEAFFLYLDEKYPEATATADSYIELYKVDKYLPYLYFLKASSFHRQKKSPTKEYYLIQKTIDSWSDVILHDDIYYSQEAKFRIAELKEMLSLHELKIGDIYFDRDDYFAAIRRYNNVLHFEQTKYHLEAVKRLIKCYKALNIQDQVDKYRMIFDDNVNYTTPEELSVKTEIKNFLYDMIPDIGFLPNWLRVTT